MQDKSFCETIMNSLYDRDNMKTIREIEYHLYQNKFKNETEHQEFLKDFATQLKTELFDESKEYRKNILRGDISPIISISKILVKNNAEPKTIFILLQPLLDMYKNLDQKFIINFTKQILRFINDIRNKNDREKLILQNFIELFEVVIILKIHQEQEVKKIGNELDDLLKITLNTCDKLDDKNYFNFDTLCNKFLKTINNNRPIIAIFLLDWLSFMCDIKELNIYEMLPDLFPWIFKMQAEKSKEISLNADKCYEKLKNIFLDKYIEIYDKDPTLATKIILAVITSVKKKKCPERSSELDLLNNLILKYNLILEEKEIQKSNSEKHDSENLLEFDPSTPAPPKFVGIHEFQRELNHYGCLVSSTDLQGENQEEEEDLLKLIPLNIFTKFLELITENKEVDEENNSELFKLNTGLRNIINLVPGEINGLNIKELTITVLNGIENKNIANKKYLLEWCELLYKKFKEKITDNFKDFIQRFVKSIPNNDEVNFMQMTEFLCSLDINENKENIKTEIINNITKKLYAQDKNFIKTESNIFFLFQKLSNKIKVQEMFEKFINSLSEINDFAFVSQMANNLNNYLITSPKAEKFKNILISYVRDKTPEYKDIYEKLYKIWSYNPLTLLSFCVVTEYYELSFNLILNLVKVKLDDDYYIYLGQLVQLLENSLYNHIRILLLEPIKNVYLVRTLYGILMLLPQGRAYEALSNRLSSIETLLEIENDYGSLKQETTSEDVKKYITIFLDVQKKKNLKKNDKKNNN